jgi:hypothetical protein
VRTISAFSIKVRENKKERIRRVRQRITIIGNTILIYLDRTLVLARSNPIFPHLKKVLPCKQK